MTKLLTIDNSRRIELPEEALESLRAKPGDSIRLRTLDNGDVVLEHTIDIMELYGSIDPKGIHLSDEELDGALGKYRFEDTFSGLPEGIGTTSREV
ncbi:MAG: AbrB/MazE/SpoVT family DNA-binding domain-containing protein [Calditrichaeota bacterium]|nr:AbrB/MazE/SpoVT family DNA-binding domain-containing protein [Calditrichota bacterium]